MLFLPLTDYACARIRWNSQRLTGCCLERWNEEGSKKPEKVELGFYQAKWNTQHISLHCTSPLVDCKHLTVLLRSNPLIHVHNLPFLLALSTLFQALPWFHPSVSEPSCKPAVFSLGVSQDQSFGWSGWYRNEGDGDVWADGCGGALQGRVDGSGSHPASHAEIQEAPGAGEPYWV